jgi:ribonuclease P protein component
MHAAPKAANAWPFDQRQTPTLPISAVDMQPLKRIKAWAQFQQLMKTPPVARSKHFVVHRATNPEPAAAESIQPAPASDQVKGLCLAALLPKRWAKRAVTRNALRRQIYAAFALQQAQLAPVPHLVRLRAAMDPEVFTSACSVPLKKAVRQEIDQLLTHLSAA